MKQSILNLHRLLRPLETRPDFVRAKVETCAAGWFVRARFRREDGSASPWIISHPVKSGDGWVLRVFALCVERAPSSIDIERLCAALNQRLRVGRFSSTDHSHGSISYLVQHFIDEPGPAPSVLNRLIDEAVAATWLCERVTQRLMERSEESLFGKMLAVNPALN